MRPASAKPTPILPRRSERPPDAVARFDLAETQREFEEEALAAADNLEFEKAALLRDQVKELKRQFDQPSGPGKALATAGTSGVSYRKGKKRR